MPPKRPKPFSPPPGSRPTKQQTVCFRCLKPSGDLKKRGSVWLCGKCRGQADQAWQGGAKGVA